MKKSQTGAEWRPKWVLNGAPKDLSTAINQIDNLEQYTRKHNLEIHGISETPEENIPEKIIKLGKILNVHVSNNDIDICHRMGRKSSFNRWRNNIKLWLQHG